MRGENLMRGSVNTKGIFSDAINVKSVRANCKAPERRYLWMCSLHHNTSRKVIRSNQCTDNAPQRHIFPF